MTRGSITASAETTGDRVANRLARNINILAWNQDVAKRGLPGEAVGSGPGNTIITIYWPNITLPMMEELERQRILNPVNLKDGGLQKVDRPSACVG